MSPVSVGATKEDHKTYKLPSLVLYPLVIEFEGITMGEVFVVALVLLGKEGETERPLAFCAVMRTTIC